MTSTALAVQKARNIAATLRHHRAAHRPSDVRVDRDQARAAFEVDYLAQTSAPRVL
ncbi:hypothetical protein [Phycicoccus flavus]|uniref:Uncharacterized protein n=1 Tax=Phycicoccus flavus TaxID=2502783 RepID=A0A8T6R613_9MICO|nr:hypothetical protein [Phycicoccus flavus]NHA69417.1 hypothetical protein [Phycicoccus flavus]